MNKNNKSWFFCALRFSAVRRSVPDRRRKFCKSKHYDSNIGYPSTGPMEKTLVAVSSCMGRVADQHVGRDVPSRVKPAYLGDGKTSGFSTQYLRCPATATEYPGEIGLRISGLLHTESDRIGW